MVISKVFWCFVCLFIVFVFCFCCLFFVPLCTKFYLATARDGGSYDVQRRWHFCWGVLKCFLSPFEDNDHFWHAVTWNLFSHDDTFFGGGCDQFLKFFWATSMKMFIFAIESVQCWWYFFFWFWSPLNDHDHFWHALRSMMVILFFWFLSDLDEDDHFLTWDLFNADDTFFWFLSDLDEDDHFLTWDLFNADDTFFLVSKRPRWRWSFFWHETCSMLMILFFGF